MRLTAEETAWLEGPPDSATTIAMRILVQMAEVMGAAELVPITSAHIDGCLYHGDGGVEFSELLVHGHGRVVVPTTLNVGALDLINPSRVRLGDPRATMARRQMAAYVELGCRPTWTCAPYQVGHRPALGEQVAWGESNAVAFANSVLGARTNRYGDYLDICCALVGRAPLTGLHLDENRIATAVVNTDEISDRLKRADAFYPVFGRWLGQAAGDDVVVLDGLPPDTTEDQLKALGASASSSGAVGLFHVAGVTPEAPDVYTALGGREPAWILSLTPEIVRHARDQLSTTTSDRLSAVALGSPHFSLREFAALERESADVSLAIPVYVCTSRQVLEVLEREQRARPLRDRGIEIIVDTCVVVTPILPAEHGVLMTNSGKFAHYTPANTGYQVVYGSLRECIRSAATGRVVRDPELWQ